MGSYTLSQTAVRLVQLTCTFLILTSRTKLLPNRTNQISTLACIWPKQCKQGNRYDHASYEICDKGGLWWETETMLVI
jgi:hypothetical protein